METIGKTIKKGTLIYNYNRSVIRKLYPNKIISTNIHIYQHDESDEIESEKNKRYNKKIECIHKN